MDSKAVKGQHKEGPASPRLGKLMQPDAAGQAHQSAPSLQDRYRQSLERGNRTAPSPGSEREQREFVTTPIMLRLSKVERQYRGMRICFFAVLLLLGYMAVDRFGLDEVGTDRTLVKSEELKLIDRSGRPRVFLRTFSEVPVIQMLDAKGNPRLSFGLRFDNTPFIDLSDSSGTTRATIQVTGAGEPALRMFDGQGESTFSIN